MSANRLTLIPTEEIRTSARITPRDINVEGLETELRKSIAGEIRFDPSSLDAAVTYRGVLQRGAVQLSGGGVLDVSKIGDYGAPASALRRGVRSSRTGRLIGGFALPWGVDQSTTR